jgi:Cdc6-like AAA superfamily ATPase
MIIQAGTAVPQLVLLLEEVFRTEGLPEFTFVAPANYNEILLDIRRLGKPVILEGQSGTGKTTCVRHVVAELGDGSRTIKQASFASSTVHGGGKRRAVGMVRWHNSNRLIRINAPTIR